MSRYRKVDTRIWNDAKFAALSLEGKLAFLFLLTHPNLTMLGAMRATVPGLAAELRMEPTGFADAFRQVLANGLAKHDDCACLLWLPKFLKYNAPQSPNVVRAWPDALDLLPECELKTWLAEQAEVYLKGLPESFQAAFQEVFGKSPKSDATPFVQSLLNQEQEQEQQEKKENTNTLALTACAVPASTPAFITLPLNDNTEYPIDEKQIAAWESLYAAVDVRQEVRNYKGWADSHTNKRKTRRGILGSVNSWLAKEQDKFRQIGEHNGADRKSGVADTKQERSRAAIQKAAQHV